MQVPRPSDNWIMHKVPNDARIPVLRSTPYTAAKSVCDSIAKYHTNLLLIFQQFY